MIQELSIANWSPPSINKLMGNHWKARDIKKQAMDYIIACAMNAKIKPVGRCRIVINCFMDNRRNDESNIEAGANKVILDALKNAGIIKNDNKQWLESSTVIIRYTRFVPEVIVEIEEI